MIFYEGGFQYDTLQGLPYPVLYQYHDIGDKIIQKRKQQEDKARRGI